MSRISCRCKLLASLEKRSLWTNHKPIALLSFSFRPPLTHIRGGEKSNNSPSHPSNLEGSQSLFRTLFGNDEELIFQIGNWFGIWNTSTSAGEGHFFLRHIKHKNANKTQDTAQKRSKHNKKPSFNSVHTPITRAFVTLRIFLRLQPIVHQSLINLH
jgi:hypothetical protein